MNVNEGKLYNATLDMMVEATTDRSMMPAYVASRVQKAVDDFLAGKAYGAIELRSWSTEERADG